MTIDKSIIKKPLKEGRNSDLAYWQSQPYEKRLEALETIREEYRRWKYADQQGFQRVHRVLKQS